LSEHPLRPVLLAVAARYPAAKARRRPGHPVARLLVRDGPRAVGLALGRGEADERGGRLVVRGSAGWPSWADVPWLGVFDPAVTTVVQKGYYAAYLFAADMAAVHLALVGSGPTGVRRRCRAETRAILRGRAQRIRRALPEYAGADFSAEPIDLASSVTLPRDYEAAHAFGRGYALADLPDEEELREDLHGMARLLRLLTRRGGMGLVVGAEGPRWWCGAADPVIPHRPKAPRSAAGGPA
jgi:MrcB-like, N-terminal domain